MIVYHPAFDLYHSVYRMLQILTHFDKNDYVETERLRIWDFYLLFPDKINTIKLKNTEKDIKDLITSNKATIPMNYYWITERYLKRLNPINWER